MSLGLFHLVLMFSYDALVAGNNKYNLKSVSHALQPEKLPASSQPIQVLLNKTTEPTNLFHTVESQVDQLRERTGRGSELSLRIKEVSNNNHPASVVASHIPSHHAIDPSSDMSNLCLGVFLYTHFCCSLLNTVKNGWITR